MSQKRTDFQSKPRSGGQKFGDKPRGRGKPAGRGFGQRSEGDKPKSFGRRSADGDRPQRRERSDFGDRPPPRRREFGDKAPSRGFGDRPPRREFGDRPPRREFGDRPPRREFGGRPERREGEGFKKPYQKKPFRDRDGVRSGERREFGDRPPRREFGDRPPRREFGDRPPRGEFGDKPARSFGDKPSRGFGDKKFGDKKFGGKKFGDKKFGDKKSFDRRDDRGAQKTYKRFDDDRRPRKTFSEDSFTSAESTAETRQKLKSDRQSYGAPSSAFLYGVHAVTEALKNPDRLHQRLLCTQEGFGAIEKAYTKADEEGLKMPQITYVEREDIERLLPRDAVHQGLLLDCQPLSEVFLADILISAPENAKIMVLDQVTDPHNIGAILRSAAAFGAIAIVMQKVNAPDVTGTMAKAASGAVEHVPIVREVNLSRALEQLKEAGFFCIGLAERGKQTLAELKLTGKTALVLGAEGDGLRRLVAENCDELVRLPTQGDIASLNVSNAAAVALYELARLS